MDRKKLKQRLYAIVMPVGVGKTTLVKSLSRYQNNQNYFIYIDIDDMAKKGNRPFKYDTGGYDMEIFPALDGILIKKLYNFPEQKFIIVTSNITLIDYLCINIKQIHVYIPNLTLFLEIFRYSLNDISSEDESDDSSNSVTASLASSLREKLGLTENYKPVTTGSLSLLESSITIGSPIRHHDDRRICTRNRANSTGSNCLPSNYPSSNCSSSNYPSSNYPSSNYSSTNCSSNRRFNIGTSEELDITPNNNDKKLNKKVLYAAKTRDHIMLKYQGIFKLYDSKETLLFKVIKEFKLEKTMI
jgi:hypothetical protein